MATDRSAARKVFDSFARAVADIPDGAVMMIDGFGGPGGMPSFLIAALRDQGARNLTVIGNTAGLPGFGAKAGQEFITTAVLYENRQVRKTIASFPVPRSPSVMTPFRKAWQAGEVELEVAPQGTLAERIRAGGAGIAAFYTPTSAGTDLAQGKETREFGGRLHVLEHALTADYAFIRAHRADTMGNLTYRGTSRNFNPAMATAARVTIAEVDEIVPAGEIDPEAVVTPGIYVRRIVQRPGAGQ
ncbi:MAG: 3-oxoacid CoA-transferase subunit A [Dehalococcoidia bacterium]|nr:3-oxoacid CoA-transferase subunit A [Dehalococcoidia bacterium]